MEKKVNSTLEDRRKTAVRLFKDNNSVLILVLFLLAGIFFIHGFSKSFYKSILLSAEYGAVSLGLGLVMITGNIDLSVGFMAALCGVTTVSVFNLVFTATGSAALAIAAALVAALAVGAVCGLLNGFVITKVGVSPLIATIATNYIFKGLVRSTANASFNLTDKSFLAVLSKAFTKSAKWLNPMVIIIVLIAALLFFWMYKTRYGNRLHVVGDNPEAASFAGINVSNTVLVTYIICGLLAAVCGFFMVSYDGYAIYTQGDSLSTLPISCCVIGGIKMAGGKGTVVHILIGVLIMEIIEIIMRCLFLQPATVNLIQGVLLILVLLIDRFTSAKEVE